MRTTNPLNGLYHTLTLLTLCTIVHFYTTGHLTAVTALKALDSEFEAVSASLKVPFYKTFWRVTLPVCTPALVDIARYFFINAMTTISAVVFLYSPETKVASIAILNLDEAGRNGRCCRHGGFDWCGQHPGDPVFHGPGLVGASAHPGLASLITIWRLPPMDRDKILLTPGPLTTTLRTKLAMLKDWGSWDADFNTVTASVRASLLAIIHGTDSHVVVPLQGSGTFSVEAAVATLVPRDGHVLVLDNGAYCKRAARLTQLMGRRCTVLDFDEAQQVSAASCWMPQLKADASITHVVLIHCETGAGVLNPLQAVADVCAATRQRLDRGRHEFLCRAGDRRAQDPL
jgi:hypothetical protein